MYSLRSHSAWKKKLDESLSILKKLGTLVARTTITQIEKKHVSVMPFSRTNLEDLKSASTMFAKSKQAKLKSKSASHVIKELKNDFLGYVIEDRVYISDDIEDPRKFAKVLAHEVNHFLNKDLPEDQNGTFEDELRATISEKMAVGKTITRQYLLKIAESVAKLNNIPLPAKISFPKGRYTCLR